MERHMKGILREVYEHMKAEGFENPDLEIRLLTEQVFGNSSQSEREITDQEQNHFDEHMEQLKRKIPVQRQIGYTIVRGKRVNINSDVLLPGPEIEVLLDAFFDYAENPKKVVDLCTGCGVLASIIGGAFSNTKVYATDISEEAINVARLNINSQNVFLLLGDLFEPLKQNKMYDVDVLISNPPYCRTQDIDKLPRQIKEHTPRIAVDGGKDGYSLHRRIIRGASKYVTNNGLVILENEAGQSPELSKMLEEKGYAIECTRKNGKGEERVIVARRIR